MPGSAPEVSAAVTVVITKHLHRVLWEHRLGRDQVSGKVGEVSDFYLPSVPCSSLPL